jgi:hypothetical protein
MAEEKEYKSGEQATMQESDADCLLEAQPVLPEEIQTRETLPHPAASRYLTWRSRRKRR